MNRVTLIAFILVILGIGGGVSWYLIDTSRQVLGVPAPVASTTPEVNESLAIYTSGPYGFSIFYPEASDVSYVFDTSYHLGSAWRVHALPEAVGSPVLSIVPYHVLSEDSYPRYYNAMVRIGASADPAEVARCEKPVQAQGESQLQSVVINGHSWSVFSFQDAGMMQYAQGVSYRTLFEGKCIAMEKVRTGSNYQEGPASPKDVSQDTLDAEYAKLEAIVQAFSFAR